CATPAHPYTSTPSLHDALPICQRLERLGVGMIIHHVGYDHRGRNPHLGLSPLTELEDIVAATSVPVQAVGGLSIEQAVSCPEHRSEEHTSELQSRFDLVCRLLL